MLLAIVFGIVAGTLCAVLDLIPGDNIWTFSSFSGSLGFWAISGMIVVMIYDKAWEASVGTFLYFAFMNTSLSARPSVGYRIPIFLVIKNE